MKNAFCFTLKALPIVKIFKFLSWFLDHVEKRDNWKDMVNFKIYVVTTCYTNNCNAHIAQYLKKEKHSSNKIWSVSRTYMAWESFVLENYIQNVTEKLYPDLSLKNPN